MTGSWWWIACGLSIIVIGLAAEPFWWYGKLGLGDVVSMLVFGLIFGLIPAVVIITAGFGLTSIGLLIHRIIKGPQSSADAIPLGPGLWGMAILVWIWLMVLMPMV